MTNGPTLRRTWPWLCPLFLLALPAAADDGDPSGMDLICRLVEHEHQRDLDDARTELELVETEYRALVRVFEMVEKLWAARAVEEEIFLDYKRQRDRTKVRITRLEQVIGQRRSMASQYELICADIRGESVDDLQARLDDLQAVYRKLDCALLASDAQIAGIDHTFHAAMLQATQRLNERNVKSRYELVIDEYDLGQAKARVDSYEARAASCRKQLAE